LKLAITTKTKGKRKRLIEIAIILKFVLAAKRKLFAVVKFLSGVYTRE
jgi:hypothetical protein